MDIFEGGPRGKFFEILSAARPALAQNKTAQAQFAQSPASAHAKCAALAERESFIAQNRALQNGLNDEFCR